jgi:hypothetical protein
MHSGLTRTPRKRRRNMHTESERSVPSTSQSVGPHLLSILELAKSFADDTRTHLSFILSKNKIVSIGQENREKTHPRAVQLGYMYPTIHSELDAFNRLSKSRRSDKLILVNTRVSPTKKLGMSKPCRYCMPWVQTLFEEVWYTNQDGVLVKHEACRY